MFVKAIYKVWESQTRLLREAKLQQRQGAMAEYYVWFNLWVKRTFKQWVVDFVALFEHSEYAFVSKEMYDHKPKG